MGFDIDLLEVTYALSDALDLMGGTGCRHGKRVAYIAVECARELGLPDSSRRELLQAAILHDCGISSCETYAHHLTELNWGEAAAHSERAFQLLSSFAPFTDIAELVRYHHTPWPELDATSLSEDRRWLATCLHLADRADALLHQAATKEVLYARFEVTGAIKALRGREFAPAVVDAFLACAQSQAFWLRMQPRHLDRYLAQLRLAGLSRRIDLPELQAAAALFARIVDNKSPYTGEHSLGVARMSHRLSKAVGFPDATCTLMEVAGLLHDLGKLGVPDNILEKPGPLDSVEFAVIEHHAFETYEILRQVGAFSELAEWAGFHHETLRGDGYPFRIPGDRLPLQSRIVTVADVFHAIGQHRPYHDSSVGREITRVLQAMTDRGKLDGEVVALVGEDFDGYWQAAFPGRAQLTAPSA